MTTDSTSIKVQMLQRAAGLAAGEESEEAWYLVHLFQRTRPRELLRICHFTLATFLELNYEYFDEGWPLQSRLIGSSTFAPTASSSSSFCRRGYILKGKAERLRSRSPPPSQIAEETLTATPARQPSIGSRMERSTPATSKSTSKRLAWLKGKYLLPSKLSIFTPNSSPAPMTSMNRSVSVVTPSTTSTKSTSASTSEFFDANKRSQRLPYYEYPDYILCRYISDFMLQTPDLLSTEGLFRRPGSLLRAKQLYSDLKECLMAKSFGKGIVRSGASQAFLSDTPPATSRSIIPLIQNRYSERRAAVYDMLSSALVYDVASVLLRCLSSTRTNSTSDSGLIPPEATDLFIKTTSLQYNLKDGDPVYALDPTTDWTHLLCHGRQLLAYRIIIQLLLPTPERHLLLKLLALLHKIASNTQETRMSSEALARCLAVAVFGIPDDAVAMGHYIDTLINLIELFEDLETLPRMIYQQVRNFLKSRLGSSPMKNPTRVSVNQVGCSPVLVDKSALKRSWATCQVSIDTSDLSSTSSGKENRPFQLSHLCLWSKTSPTENQHSRTPSPAASRRSSMSSVATSTHGTPSKMFSGMQHQRPRAPSPFLIWKKQRSVLSMKKSKSLCLSAEAGDKKIVSCGFSPLR
ncbi:hypothetical protein TcWFU_002426 [Taenia crassiceps]|uniref:Rho-GAP domain-containing protein n=1 Tax=Taenia crassiceps TaxID=6207 RepID=A0ABR4QKN8_9CEST